MYSSDAAMLLNSSDDPCLAIADNDLDQILASYSSEPSSPLHFDLDDLYGRINEEQIVSEFFALCLKYCVRYSRELKF